MRVMMRMLTTTYGESVSSTPMCAMCEPSGPMLYGITYIVRPRMQPSKSLSSVARISAGSTQLLLGPASSFVAAADEGAIFHARDVVGIGAREEAAGALRFVQLDQHAGVDHLLVEPVVFLLRAVAPVDARGLRELRDLRDPVSSASRS